MGIFFYYIYRIMFARSRACTKKRRLRYCSSTRKGLRTYPIQSTNNNETYADMTTLLPRKGRYGMNVIPVGVIAYFVSD